MIKIAPSLLAADFKNLGDEVKKIYDGGADYLHLDVMDGAFVPNISFGPAVIGSLRGICDIPFDVHLMINDPMRYIGKFADVGADIITIHYESCDDPASVLKEIRRLGKKAGVSIKPKTDTAVLIPLLEYVDMILVMSVEPGFGGQKYMDIATKKLEKVRAMIDASGYDIDLEVDGGIDGNTVSVAAGAGANVLVAGTSIFGAKDVGDTIKQFRLKAEKAVDNG
ncbi:MAG: ribulose-phosphate 3-epimerase [Clostridia bacterium]|nr:ribulose-phosphate 3-epimerase [Clostridia bacterium]MBO4428705.1 ribulose-phosphate 3-epimerase [Clostridia bacterium]